MTFDYVLVIIATVLLAVEFTFQKIYQRKCGTDARAGLFFNAAAGLISAVIFFFVSGFQVRAPLYALAMAACMSICQVGYTVLGFRVLKAGNLAFYTMFLMTGGMVVPYVFGLVWLDEPFQLLRLLGLVIILISIVLPNLGAQKAPPKILLLCVAIFFLNGCCSISSKLCQTPNPYGTVSPSTFVFLTGTIRFFLCSAALLLLPRKKETKPAQKRQSGEFCKHVLPVILGATVISGTSYMLQLMGAANLPATVLYPIVSGGSILFSALAGMLFFREKLNLSQKLAVGLCLLGTCLFL